ncbi:MAG: cation:proton antiporter [Cyclobacteriaceae bacterium]|nr:cation:proton antiporter [Cyclobacteriaceae bacterium]MDH4295322.1 cation:proton antiporter [Cyclobacteriaceae bacterium]
MAHLPPLIIDLALILAVAGITTLIFKRIHQPVVLGYVIAGFLVGPHVSLIPTVVDAEGIRIWSEIGVIFLLFSLGLEFSFKKLIKVGGAASVTALVGVTLMNGAGYLTGYLLGWGMMDSIFLGAILSISSTTIIMRAFDELGVRTKKFATLVVGVLVVQDFVAILLLVLLSTFAVSRQFAGYELLNQILKLLFFLILWFLAGIFFIPTFFKGARSLLNDETMLIVSIALCLLMVWLAVEVGFSAALGAFIMGSILAETTQAERIENLIKSVKNLFAAIFFISVGMMIDPGVLIEYSVSILIITAIIIVGMTLTITLGAILSGQSLQHSIQAGMSLAQIGEFSFIIALLGASLKVTNAFLYPIAVAASALTTFTTPFLIKSSGSVYAFLETHLPQRWIKGMNRYSTSSQQLSAFSEWKEIIRAYVVNSAIHSVLIGALIFFSEKFIKPFVSELLKDDLIGSITSIVLTLMLMIPFIWALSIRRIKRDAYANLWLNKKLNRGPLIAIEITRIALAVFLVSVLIDIYFSLSVAFFVAILSMAIATVLFNWKLQRFYERIEHLFLSNLNERERQRPVKQEITPWDAHLATFDVQSQFKHSGKQLKDLQLREKYGVNIALIERGAQSIVTPDRYERLYPGDKLSIIGTDDQLALMKDVFEDYPNSRREPEIQEDEITLQNYTITKDSRLYNQTIRNSGIRNDANALVVGFERNGQRILNPESSVYMQEGDIVWIVGVKQKLQTFFDNK